MIVLYLKENQQFLQSIPGFPETKEENGKLLLKVACGWAVAINDLNKAGYAEYPDQKIEVPIGRNEEGGITELPATVQELHLRDFTQEEMRERQKLSRDLYLEVDQLKDKMHRLEAKQSGR